MKKTVWITNQEGMCGSYYEEEISEGLTKATLIVEEPEPEITITPSRLREAIDRNIEEGELWQEGFFKELFGENE